MVNFQFLQLANLHLGKEQNNTLSENTGLVVTKRTPLAFSDARLSNILLMMLKRQKSICYVLISLDVPRGKVCLMNQEIKLYHYVPTEISHMSLSHSILYI